MGVTFECFYNVSIELEGKHFKIRENIWLLVLQVLLLNYNPISC